jgi:hypothetical protein
MLKGMPEKLYTAFKRYPSLLSRAPATELSPMDTGAILSGENCESLLATLRSCRLA